MNTEKEEETMIIRSFRSSNNENKIQT